MLTKILDVKREEISSLTLPAEKKLPGKSLFQALSSPNRSLGLIAEVKKASPSKGVIKPDFEPVKIADSYARAKADAISVLTDQNFFQGHADYLTAIKSRVDIPVLRKDFIIDSIQIKESKWIGADAILLIGEALEPGQLYEFYLEAYEMGLECLVEVHSAEVLEGILKEFTPKIIGVNNRDLTKFKTDIAQTAKLSSFIPSESLLVSESGIHTKADLEFLAGTRADAMLVGEALMKEADPGNGIQKLFGERA